LLQLLRANGWINDEAERLVHAAMRESPGERPASVLLRLGLISEEKLLQAQAELHGCEVWPSSQLAGLMHSAQRGCRETGLSEAMAKRLEFLVVRLNDDVADPHAFGIVARDVMRADVQDWLVAQRLDKSIAQRWLIAGRDFDRVVAEVFAKASTTSLSAKSLQQMAEDAPVIELVNGILARATDSRASDIHLEPEARGFTIRYRVDGVLTHAEHYTREKFDAVVSRLKLISGLDIAERRLPQDGRFSAKMAGVETDVRVSVIPSVAGESLVLRLLPNTQGTRFNLKKMGMEPDHLAMYKSWMSQPDGIVLVTGPTGSGKSTTLYATLAALDTERERIMTVEDPVEYQVEGVTQFQVHSDIGFDFATALRAMLRHDPDTIMVGEIRDVETARIAVQSSLTGHRVFSTLHTNDSATAFLRLADMGVEPFLIAATVRGVVAQRLVRRLCECAEPLPASDLPRDIAAWRQRHATSNEVERWRRPVGCTSCEGTGYRGRLAVYELLPASTALREALVQLANVETLRKTAPSSFRSLKDDALIKAMRGETSLAEALTLAVGSQDI
jgi:general secretion pathway protein E